MLGVLVAQPGYGLTLEQSSRSAFTSSKRRDKVHVDVYHKTASLLAFNFNLCLAYCLKHGYDYFAMLHTDVAADGPWVDVLMQEMEAGGSDLIHAPVALKDGSGATTTAVAYSDDEWELRRKLTSTELSQLPPTFDADTLRKVYDPRVVYLLPNTGCMLMQAKTWLRDFPGFEIRDRMTTNEAGERIPENLSEDWNLGYWCGRNGVKVAATTKVVTHHWGMFDYRSSIVAGSPVDANWQKKTQLQGATI